MKTKYNITAIAATVIACGIASAGTAPAQSASVATDSGIGGYIGVSGVHNEYTIDLLDADGDANGIRFNAGLLLGNGFSIDGRLETVSGDFEGEDFDFTDSRIFFNYTTEISPGFMFFAGPGYGKLDYSIYDDLGNFIEEEGDAILLNAGFKYTSDAFSGALVYTHALANSYSGGAVVDGIVDEPRLVGEGEDFGLLELSLNYDLTENLAATFSVETQVNGDTSLEKDWGVALGLQYDF
jgi:hypothetical protein